MNTHTLSQPSKSAIFGQLALKDWTLNRWPLLGYLLAGLASLALFAIPNAVAFHAAIVILVSVVVVVGVHLVFATVVHEGSNKTLPFILSLPITFLEYSVAKLLFAVAIFTTACGVLAFGIYGVVQSQAHLHAGMMPYYLIVMGYLYVAFALTMAVAMVTESNVWTIVVMSVCNISISIVMIAIARMPSINATMGSDTANWNGAALGLLGIEAAAVLVLLLLTLFIQSRKTEFI